MDQYSKAENRKEVKDDTNLSKAKVILMQALPSSGANFLGCATSVVNLYYFSMSTNHSQTSIAGFGLGQVLIDVIFVALGFGLNGALETFVSQAGGQKNYKLCSEYLHRSRIIVTICFLMTMVILLHAESILLFLGQDREASAFAQQYIKYTSFSFYMLALNDGTRRYLNSLSLSYISFQVYLVGAISQVILSEFLIVHLKMGMMGVSIALSMTYSITFIGLNLYPLLFEEARQVIKLPTMESTRGIQAYLTKGLPLSLMLCFEWLAFKFLILMSGQLGVAVQATQTVFTTVSILFIGPIIGMQTSISCQVGKQIGRQDIEKARAYYNVGKWMARTQILMTASIFYASNQFIIGQFTNSRQVKAVWDSVAIFVAFNYIPDHWQTFSQGVVRGLGVQDQLVKFILLIYWIVQIPLCYSLTFVLGFGYRGLWIGQSITLCFIGFCINFKVSCADWHACSVEAQERSAKSALKG